MWMCGAMAVAAVVLVVATGSAYALLPGLGCVLMLAVMVWMMGRIGRGGGPSGGPK
jgi:hypothetical protein